MEKIFVLNANQCADKIDFITCVARLSFLPLDSYANYPEH